MRGRVPAGFTSSSAHQQQRSCSSSSAAAAIEFIVRHGAATALVTAGANGYYCSGCCCSTDGVAAPLSGVLRVTAEAWQRVRQDQQQREHATRCDSHTPVRLCRVLVAAALGVSAFSAACLRSHLRRVPLGLEQSRSGCGGAARPSAPAARAGRSQPYEAGVPSLRGSGCVAVLRASPVRASPVAARVARVRWWRAFITAAKIPNRARPSRTRRSTQQRTPHIQPCSPREVLARPGAACGRWVRVARPRQNPCRAFWHFATTHAIALLPCTLACAGGRPAAPSWPPRTAPWGLRSFAPARVCRNMTSPRSLLGMCPILGSIDPRPGGSARRGLR
jgi:hypothetical protein